ncbi:DUF2971 domain-containing protein [Oleiharenicola lentus]|uniref:DUF2971 domain-containing protein n=1 Tax=Oleiharenicola lentus TaxID=2508720 RepID=A0A4Q1C5A5_9BACT|nr:DUF2971 domain-containing protein [Oleiharenicola lentus]RXK53469.1 DUF2971 domain-containing protein [Oleiharenicola lentus]
MKTLEQGELHVSRLAELNDPFEFRPALAWVNPVFPHGVVDQFLGFLVREFNPKMGIVSFSEEIGDPVLWSHYADKHRGMALAFDVIRDDSLWPMAYPEERPTFDVQKFPGMTLEEAKAMVHRILAAKAPSWRYEREQRVFVDLPSSRLENGHYFHRIPADCLVQVVLGIACPVREVEVQEALWAGGLGEVAVVRARRCLTKFKVLV